MMALNKMNISEGCDQPIDPKANQENQVHDKQSVIENHLGP